MHSGMNLLEDHDPWRRIKLVILHRYRIHVCTFGAPRPDRLQITACTSRCSLDAYTNIKCQAGITDPDRAGGPIGAFPHRETARDGGVKNTRLGACLLIIVFFFSSLTTITAQNTRYSSDINSHFVL